MSHLFHIDRVKYLCSCGMQKPITGIYLCRHCLKLRCSNCVSHEVDTLYCPHCLENMPSTEARLKKNKCANCFDCPSCRHSLSTRVASLLVPSTDEANAQTTRKAYYLGCASCRWTSRDVGLEDQNTATGGWPELDNPHYKRIQDLMEYHRNVAQREKLETERRRSSKRKSNMSLTEKYILSSPYSSSFIGRKSLSSFSQKTDVVLPPEIEPAVAQESVEGLPESIFTDDVDLNQITTLDQRLASPEFQPEKTSDLYPIHKHLLCKHSHRCRRCEHNLSKPEYNPSSVKFKIQLGAFYHMPEIRLMKQVDLKWGVTTQVQLSLSNPTPHDMIVALLPLIPEAHLESEEEVSSTSSLGSMMRVVNLPREKRDLISTADVALPQGQFTLLARDDTAEYDEVDSSSSQKDDPQVVAWRRANKVGVNIEVTPHQDCCPVNVGLVLRYDYTNTVSAISESRTVTLNIPVMIHVGNIE